MRETLCDFLGENQFLLNTLNILLTILIQNLYSICLLNSRKNIETFQN